ncbi:MAG: hypothetical protein WKG00_21865 [Polyangiaceae bacterium]
MNGGVEGDPAVSLEVLAEVTAALEVGAPRGEVLARAGLDEARWTAARDALLERLAARAAGGDLRMAQRFADLVARGAERVREERQGKPRPLDGKLPVAPEARLLRIWRSGAPAPAIQATPAIHAVPAMHPASAIHAAPAIHVAPAVHLAPATAAFHVPAAAVPPAFGNPSAPVPAAPQTAPPPAAAASASARYRGTGPIPLSARQPALPFSPDGRAPVARPSGGGARPSHLPFSAPQAQAAAWKVLEDYARLCARVRAAPARVPELMVELGLDTSAWREMHAAWSRRFEQNPSLRTHWQRLVDAHTTGRGLGT